jgi:hypothetical protein
VDDETVTLQAVKRILDVLAKAVGVVLFEVSLLPKSRFLRRE